MDLFKYDTHTHTSETSGCGKVSGRKLVQLYMKAGYRGVVITDHYYKEYFDCMHERSWYGKIKRYLAGYRNARSEAECTGLKVILGMEIRLVENYNDYLIYGLDERFLEENRDLYNLGLKELKELAGEKGLLIFQAHPFRIGIEAAEPFLLDGIEIYNGNPRQNSRNNLAYSYAAENNLKMLSGSDFHQVEDLARGGIAIPEDISESRELVRVINEDKIIKLLGEEP